MENLPPRSSKARRGSSRSLGRGRARFHHVQVVARPQNEQIASCCVSGFAVASPSVLAGNVAKRRGRLGKWARGSLSLKQKTVPSRVCGRRQPWENRKTTRQESKNTHRATQTSRAQTLPIRKHAKQPAHGGIVSKATLCVFISNWPPCSTPMHNCGVYGPHACLTQQPRCIG